MTAQSLTSVIMVTFHTGPALDKAIASVLAQNVAVELVLVNNGNPPEVEAQLIERFKDDPSVRLMTAHGDIGRARGQNLGARVASGERLLFLSSRAVLRPDALHRLMEEEQLVKRPFVMGARLVNEEGQEIASSRRSLPTPENTLVEMLGLQAHFSRYRTQFHKDPLPKKICPVQAVGHSCMYMMKEDFLRLHGFDEAYQIHAEDMDFCVRFRRKGGKIYFVPDIVVTLQKRPEKAPFMYEKMRQKDALRYFSETFGDSYFHPYLWLFYAALWVRFAFKFISPDMIRQAVKDFSALVDTKIKKR